MNLLTYYTLVPPSGCCCHRH